MERPMLGTAFDMRILSSSPVSGGQKARSTTFEQTVGLLHCLQKTTYEKP